MRTFQPERALITRETRIQNRQELDNMLSQIAMERAARLPPPVCHLSLESQFQESIRRSRQEVQRTKDAQAAHILRWLQS